MIWTPPGGLYFTTAPTFRTFLPFDWPVSVTDLGLPRELSVNTRFVVFVPVEVGAKVRVTVQEFPFVSVPVQVLAPIVNWVVSPVERTTLVKVIDTPL